MNSRYPVSGQRNAHSHQISSISISPAPYPFFPISHHLPPPSPYAPSVQIQVEKEAIMQQLQAQSEQADLNQEEENILLNEFVNKMSPLFLEALDENIKYLERKSIDKERNGEEQSTLL